MTRSRSLNTLQRSAAEAATIRGHRLRWSTQHGESRTLRVGVCAACEMEVTCDANPPANGIDIGGEAVALNCTGKARFTGFRDIVPTPATPEPTTVRLLSIRIEGEDSPEEVSHEVHRTLESAQRGACEDAAYADDNDDGNPVSIAWEDDGDGGLVGYANGAVYRIAELKLEG